MSPEKKACQKREKASELFSSKAFMVETRGIAPLAVAQAAHLGYSLSRRGYEKRPTGTFSLPVRSLLLL
jgi:hypothetical protein